MLSDVVHTLFRQDFQDWHDVILRRHGWRLPGPANGQAERRAEGGRSSLLFGGILFSPPSWQQFERSRKTGTDTDGGKIAAIRRQRAVDVPSLSYSDDSAVDEPQVECR